MQFILGRAGYGKTHFVLDAIANELRIDPLGSPIWLVVPDQATLLYERMLIAQPGLSGYLRCRVTGFRQFGDRILSEVGGVSVPEITALGRRMLIGRLLRSMGDQLSFYRSSSRQAGVADTLDALFTEFEQADLATADLDFIAGDIEVAAPSSQLPAKLRDLRLLYDAYRAHLGQDRLDPHRRQQQVNAAIARASSLGRATMYVDAFYDFSKTERDLLAKIALAGCSVRIALTLDPADEALALSKTPIDETDPFRRSILTYRRLRDTFERAHVPLASTVALRTPKRFQSTALTRIERQLCERRGAADVPESTVRLIATPTRRDEVLAAARQVRDWLADGWRLRDVAVLARNIDDYQADIQAIFPEHGIRFFIDRQRPGTYHPLLQVVRAALAITLDEWPHEAVMALAKSSLTSIDTDAAQRLENFVRRHRIEGPAWTGGKPWSFVRRDAEDSSTLPDRDDVEPARRALRYGLAPLLDARSRQLPLRDHAAALVNSLERLGVRKTLTSWIERSGEALEQAEEHLQLWAQLVELLDQMVDVLGDEPTNLDDFARVLDVGLERFSLAIVPPTLDQVIVGSVDRTRLGPTKGVVLLGLAEGQFPARTDADAAFPDAERQQLAQRNIELRDTSRQRLFDETFLGYIGLTRASEKLTVTRSLRDGEGREQNPSSLFTRLQSLFPKNPIEMPGTAVVPCLYTPAQIADALLDWANDRVVDPTLAWVYQQVATPRTPLSSLRKHEIAPVWRALRYDNSALLSSDIAGQLYPSPLTSSISRIESFAACPFQHFARFGLRLREREEADVTALDMGNLYHGILDALVRHAIAHKHDLRTPIPDVETKIRQHAQELGQALRDQILLSSKRNEHLLERAAITLEAVIEAQRHLLDLGKLDPRFTELAFGDDPNDALPALQIETPKGRVLRLRGKIDRVDLLGSERAAVVIDYKSGHAAPDLDRIWLGLSLQLMTYLLVLQAQGQTLAGQPLTPAAALYVKLSRSLRSEKHPTDAGDPATPEFHLTQSKPTGFIHQSFWQQLDSQTQPGKVSPGYKLRVYAKPPEPKHKYNDVLTPEAFDALLNWTRRKLAELADQIAEGVIAIRPYKLGQLTPCPSCAYHAVCRRDPRFNHYHLCDARKDVRLDDIIAEAGAGT
ncbi:MAG: exodeoxyribonuclease V subunit gamma [Tepidisphaeraceae bacterium]